MGSIGYHNDEGRNRIRKYNYLPNLFNLNRLPFELKHIIKRRKRN